jgi:hypothetical protein
MRNFGMSSGELMCNQFALPGMNARANSRSEGSGKGLSEMTFGLSETIFGVPGLIFGLPEVIFGLPGMVFGLPETTFGLPEANFGSPGMTFGMPEAVFGSPEMTFGSPETISESQNCPKFAKKHGFLKAAEDALKPKSGGTG